MEVEGLIISTRQSGIPADGAEDALGWMFHEAKELGLGGVELSVSPPPMTRRPASADLVLPSRARSPYRAVWPEALDEEARGRVREKAAAAGVAMTSLSSEWVWSYCSVHPSLDSGWERAGEC
jgi:hypothetical protein